VPNPSGLKARATVAWGKAEGRQEPYATVGWLEMNQPKIWLTDLFWKQPATGPDSQAAILVHEWSDMPQLAIRWISPMVKVSASFWSIGPHLVITDLTNQDIKHIFD
jgi:hypothetical protein